jgi:2-hydroxychromene-2-carboxylate isomerase
MSEAIEFYFDFSSPYGYLASHRIDDIGARHGRDVTWRPYLMGATFKITGRQPLVNHPLVRDYARHDMERTARRYSIPFRMPEPFPVATVAASRSYYWVEREQPDQARGLAQAMLHAYFVDNRDISDSETVLDVAAARGLDRTALAAGMGDQALKDRLRDVTQNAIERGIFGSPFIIVDGEAFWGNDRLNDVEQWLASGGW